MKPFAAGDNGHHYEAQESKNRGCRAENAGIWAAPISDDIDGPEENPGTAESNSCDRVDYAASENEEHKHGDVLEVVFVSALV